MKYAYKNVILPQIIEVKQYRNGSILNDAEKAEVVKRNTALGYVYLEDLGRWVHPKRTWFGKRSKTSQIIDDNKVLFKNIKKKWTRKQKFS